MVISFIFLRQSIGISETEESIIPTKATMIFKDTFSKYKRKKNLGKDSKRNFSKNSFFIKNAEDLPLNKPKKKII